MKMEVATLENQRNYYDILLYLLVTFFPQSLMKYSFVVVVVFKCHTM